MTKYRIKKITYSDGEEFYKVQVKDFVLLPWYDYKSLYGKTTFDNLSDAEQLINRLRIHVIKTEFYEKDT